MEMVLEDHIGIPHWLGLGVVMVFGLEEADAMGQMNKAVDVVAFEVAEAAVA